MDGWINASWFPKFPVNHESREIRTTRPGLRKDPFPALAAAAVVAAAALTVADIVAEVVVDRTVMVGAVVEFAAVEKMAGVSGSWRDRVARVTESEAAEKGWPDARAVSVHMQLGTTSSETVAADAVAVGSMVSGVGSERWEWCCSGRN